MMVTSLASVSAKSSLIVEGYDKVTNEMTEVIGFYTPKKQVEFSKKVLKQLEGQQIVSWSIAYVSKKANDTYFSTF